MKLEIDTLPDDPALLKKLLLEMSQKYAYLEEKFRLAQHKQFGKSAESHPGQGELFNEAEQLTDQSVDEPAVEPAAVHTESISYQRKKPTRQALPKDLPREVIITDLADEEKSCNDCGHQLHRMGEDKSERLEFIPAQVKVIEYVRPKYSCRHCEQQATSVRITQAAPTPSPIPKSFATASLLSHIMISKYQYGLPLYRQERLLPSMAFP